MDLPKIDPEITKISKQYTERQEKQDKRNYLKDHVFDIINSCIALLALVVAVIALFFQKS